MGLTTIASPRDKHTNYHRIYNPSRLDLRTISDEEYAAVRELGRVRNHIARLYCAIKQRCYQTDFPFFYLYGGKGVKICPEWLTSKDAFIDWCHANGWQEGLTIDRIDSNGDYSPENCRFVTRKAQSRNIYPNLYLDYKGKMRLVQDVLDEEGITEKGQRNLIVNRLHIGWPLNAALTLPKHARCPHVDERITKKKNEL
ncbi:hypothetical protein Q5H92_13825 [Hymenobacter sp. M29]|uniref:HNH nuclease domain-containing protein n=1 Tax=Hymenobacter mellowenesis TaxID=3063995 RepID=A0ABT9ADJ8_9BACT|nr:hypothetical protein [Hymenobacter sp. M29]MDO7847444.1 hypothetical protein [Hymenobacter sp. M29]